MRKFYILICNWYNFLFSIIENYLYFEGHKIKINSNILTRGFELIHLKNKVLTKNIESKIKLNPYMCKDILSDEEIFDLINSLFVGQNLAHIITEKTGFNYSIDYMISYTTFHLPLDVSNKQVYANLWHNDKPFTKNALKIIIPLNHTGRNGGGIEVLSIDLSKKLNMDRSTINIKNYFIMENNIDEILLFFPNLCHHRAGNPVPTVARHQIMFQLNPSKEWNVNLSIYKKQFKIEPKFPFICYLFDKKIKLKNKKIVN